MGLFDELSGMVSNALGGGSIQDHLMGALREAGVTGISGLVQKFDQAGLGSQIASWVGTGENLPITADQVEQALGNPAIAALAQKFGIDPAQVTQLISQHLPGVVDRMTPDGQVPDTN